MRLRNFCFSLIIWAYSTLAAVEPQVVYLTWLKDPSSTMTVQWHVFSGEGESKLDYRTGNGEWTPASGEHLSIDGTDVDVHTIHLEGLKEDADYVIKFEGGKREYKFRTMPKTLTRSVRMAIGGDAYFIHSTEMFQRMCRMIAFQDPDFIVVGGDLAYTKGHKQLLKGRKWELARWQGFLRGLQRATLSKDGRLIPMLPIVGNHDVGKILFTIRAHQMFYQIFSFPEPNKAYRSLDFGDYLSLIMLDSNHTHPIQGEQTTWLEETLKQKRNFTLAAYHVAAYPSHYPFDGKIPQMLRKYWVPLLEKYQVPFVFEHHNHTFKRTHPIKEDKVDPSGVTYLGDGCWGVMPRKVNSPDKLWYLDKSESINMCYIVTLTEEKCLIEVKDVQGEVFDQIETSRQ